MEINRISSLKRDADVFVTFEGDNVVMLQVRNPLNPYIVVCKHENGLTSQ